MYFVNRVVGITTTTIANHNTHDVFHGNGSRTGIDLLHGMNALFQVNGRSQEGRTDVVHLLAQKHCTSNQQIVPMDRPAGDHRIASLFRLVQNFDLTDNLVRVTRCQQPSVRIVQRIVHTKFFRTKPSYFGVMHTSTPLLS